VEILVLILFIMQIYLLIEIINSNKKTQNKFKEVLALVSAWKT
jgi:hypothetical protein